MDIVTHAMIGMIGAAPAMADSPLGAIAFAFGSVAPDLDALSRLFGKKAFMTCHQTYSHALPVILILCLAVALVGWSFGINGLEVAIGLGLGMTIHSLLDVSNTYGIKLFAPFSHQRLSSEWVFFIELPVIIVTCATLGLTMWQFQLDPSSAELFWIGISYWTFVAVYWSLKGLLKIRAASCCPPQSCLIPCAFVPWRFLGSHQSTKHQVDLFIVNTITQSETPIDSMPIQSSKFESTLSDLPEFQTMRQLSPMFHVVDVEESNQGTKLICQDLRTRNFNTRFGQLDIELSPNSEVTQRKWHV